MFHSEYRSNELEIMDNLQCQGTVVAQTLQELEIINRWLGGNQVTIKGIRKILSQHPENHKRTITIADLGCGGGDMLKLIARWAEKEHYQVELTGIDANPYITHLASNNCRDYANINFETLDIFSRQFSEKKFDIITGTLLIHHFPEEQLIQFFKQVQSQCIMGAVINDLHRHWLAYHSIKILTRIFSQSAMVKFDAPLSVARAFKRHELEILLKTARIGHYQLHWHWAFRWQLVMVREKSNA